MEASIFNKIDAKRVKYNPEQLSKALESVRNDERSQRAAAKLFGVSQLMPGNFN